MKIKEIVQKLTLDEKILLLNGKDVQTTLPIERLGIEENTFIDGPHGLRDYFDESFNPTHFPNMCCIGASWDKEAMYKMGEAIGKESVAHGVSVLLAPGINIKRYILNGRNSEYFSEDPVVSGEMAASYINGVQSMGIGTSIKHLAANNQEYGRLFLNAEIDERTLRELYLKGFEIVIEKSNPECVMSAYNKVNAVFCSENKFLLKTVLRDEWKYDGFTVSDWGGVHNPCYSLMAGTDMLMPPSPVFLKKIKKGMEEGIVTEERIDEAVERILKSVMKTRPRDKNSFNRDDHHKLARELAASGIVLLKNENDVLPITREKYKKIVVLGGFAENPIMTGQGSPEVYPSPEYIESPLAELMKLLPDTEFEYHKVFDKMSIYDRAVWMTDPIDDYVKDADLVLFFVGSKESEESENFDRNSPYLNPIYEYVINRASVHRKKTAIVVQTGSAVIFGDGYLKADSIVEMWFGGEAAGGAIADVLTGKVNPSGKLTETFPKVMRTDLKPLENLKLDYAEKLDVGYRYYDKHTNEIMFPFGHGLSYTKFEYSDFTASISQDGIKARVTVENVGEADGAEVVQLYIGYPDSTVTRPTKDLKAFDKVFLKKGEKKTLELFVPIKELAYYNIGLREWIIEKGRYEVFAAASSQDIRLKAVVEYEKEPGYSMEATGFLTVGESERVV